MEYLDVFNVILVVLVISLVYLFFATPRPVESFSGFYILNSSGYFGDYPNELPYGHSFPLIIGVANNEYDYVEYSINLEGNGNSKIVEDFGLEHNSSIEIPFSLNVNWLGNNNVTFSLLKNGEPTNLSLRLWVEGSSFSVLNETNGFEVRSSIPLFFDLPLSIFLMNPFNVSQTFSLQAQYPWAGQNISETEITDLGTFNISPMQVEYVPYSIEIDKFDTNPITFTVSSENYTASRTIEIEGDLYYMLNETEGYQIPNELSSGTELTVKLGLHYLWYVPGYTPTDLTLNHLKLKEDGVNYTSLSQFNFTMEHGDFREFGRTQTIGQGDNIFVFEIASRHFYDTITLNVKGV